MYIFSLFDDNASDTDMKIYFILSENKSSSWFEYNPKQSPVDDDNPFRKLFSDIGATDQTGFIVLEMGIDDIKIEGGGHTESEEHIADSIVGPVLPGSGVPRPGDNTADDPLGRSTPLGDGPAIEVETGSRGSGSSNRTFIAHPSEEDLRDGVFSPNLAFKITASVGNVWLNCPTPLKKTGLDKETVPTNAATQLRSFTR